MIDLKALANELHQARLARINAEAASTDVEEMIWTVQHLEPGRGRFCFFIEGLESDTPLAPAS